MLGKYIVYRLHGVGNVLEVRGVAGNSDDIIDHNELLATLKPYPKIHIVASIWGQWDDSVSESAISSVISGLPTINCVATEGGSYGAVEAFEEAGRPIPLVMGDDRGTFLKWWATQYKKDGYTTLSAATDPDVGAGAVYIAVRMAEGKPVPKYMQMPDLVISQSSLSAWLKVTPASVSAASTFNNSWFQAHLLNQKLTLADELADD